MQLIKICAITTVPVTMNAFVVKAMEHLAKNGYQVTLVCNMDDEFRKRYGKQFNCIHVPMARGIDPVNGIIAVWRMYRLFRKEQFDIVQYATPNASMYASLAAWMARVPARVYCQWGIRYIGFSGWKRRLFHTMERMVCRFSTHIRPASRKNLQFAVDENLYSANKADIIGHGGTIGVDFSIFDVEKKRQWRAEIHDLLGLHEKTVFGFVGRVHQDKGIIELLSAFRDLISDRLDIALILVGSEFDGNSLNKEVIQWANDCENVRFCGHVYDTYRYMAAMDVLVHPTYREGFSMVIQEAAALSVPVITTDVPGPSEVIVDNVTGILVPPQDIDRLKSAMNGLLNDPALREQMGKKGLERDREFFSRELMLENTLNDRNKIVGDVNT